MKELKEFKNIRISFNDFCVLNNSISINGDVNGDGIINRDDVILSSKHIIKGNLITGVEYLRAVDVDNNDITDINDIIKMVRNIK